ncbi:MAG: thioredoxin family protein [Sulfurimonadaceae bacterium]
MAFIEVDESNITAVLAEEFSKENTVILKFGSEWCEPCHALESELEDVDDDNENVSVLMIDTDESADLAAQYSVYQLPTMVIYKKENEMIYRGEGVMLAQDIEEIIKGS